MQTLLRWFTAIAVTLLLCFAAVGAWLYYWPVAGYDRASAAAFTPATEGDANATGCLPKLHVYTVEELRPQFPALRAAEGDPTDGHYTVQLARILSCPDASQKTFVRQMRELRLAAHLRRQFTREEQMTMFLNVVYFSDEQRGIDAAAKSFFNQTPLQIDTAKRALLAGLIARPAYSSVLQHPDHALQRRNEVLQRMREQGMLSGSAWRRARAEPLLGKR
ncbi:MAG: transglycosylase domain-containing protein [Acidobacteriaceae bacterium]|nr:transglycosylase domain-containing protein [Acidobacteriaceae bacterium]